MKNPILFAKLSGACIKRFIALITIFALFSNSVFAATFTVDNSGNAADATPGNGVCATAGAVCTLRAAIEEANSLAGTDTISAQAGTTTINPAATLTISSNVVINSTTTNTLVLDGNDGVFDAITLDSNSDGSQIKGMYIHEFTGNAINIASGADSITIGGTSGTDGNVIGLTSSGSTTDAANTSNGILSYGTNVLIQNNTISNNTGRGILLQNGAKDTRILRNLIGLKVDGTTAAGNGGNGIEVSGTAVSMDAGDGGVEGLIIGGSNSASEDNTIASNGGHGISIGTSTGGNSVAGTVKIKGNKIGLNSSSGASGNTGDGIFVGSDFSTSSDVTVGTDGDGTNDSSEGNTIGSNGDEGIEITEADDVVIAGNWIGESITGTARGNTGIGIQIGALSGSIGPNTVRIGSDVNGTSDSSELNSVVNNSGGGIQIYEATTINVSGNYIGISMDGTTSAANPGGGALSSSAPSASIINIGKAGMTGASMNYIGGGQGANGAITISNSASGAAIVLKRNFIGVDTGWGSEANNMSGMYLTAPANYTIGTDLDGVNDSAESNITSNNTGNGIYVGNGALTATIAGNNIGCVPVGFGACTVAAGNGTTGSAGEKNGIKIASNSLTALTIGGSDNNQRNVIDSNGEHGISITDAGSAIAFTIRNNYFGWGSDGTTALGNTGSGISAADGGAISIIDNIIGNSSADAVSLTGGTSLTFTGNKIGTDSTGVTVGTNAGHGLVLNNSTMTSAVIGGSTAGVSNIFASATGSAKDGIYIQQLASNAATVSIKGNYIGVCATTSTGAISTTNLATCKNSGNGIEALYGALTIGGDNSLGDAGTGTIAEGNVISGNTLAGIKLGGSNVSQADIYGNIIGLVRESGSATGVFNVADGNGIGGVSVISSGINTFLFGAVGATTASSKRNVIASSGSSMGLGILTIAATGIATIKNNFIGTDWLGTTDRGNASDGVRIGPTVAGMTVNLGGTATNEGNVISGNADDGVDVYGSNAITVNMYQNLIGMAYGGATKLANDFMGVNLTNNSATVTIGNAETTGRNVISGNTSYGIKVTGGNVTVRGNYIGTDASATASSTFANGTNEIYAESTSGSISALRIGGSLNRINDLTHVGVYLKDITTWNETNSYLETDNEWSSRVNATTPTYNYWQRYVGGTLATYGPQSCYDYVDNDSDGLTDYSSDPGCESVRDSDEFNNPSGGGVVIGIGSVGGSTPSASSTDTASTTDTGRDLVSDDAVDFEGDLDADSDIITDREIVAEDDFEDVAEESTVDETESAPAIYDREIIEDRNVRKYIVREKLAEAVNTTTDILTGKERVNTEILLSDKAKVAEKVDEFPVVLTQDQRVVAEAVENLANGQDMSEQQIEKVERTLEAVISQSVQQILENAVAGATGGTSGELTEDDNVGTGGTVVVPVRAANGKLINIDKDTKLEFTLNGKKAADLQEIADARGENKVYLTSYTPVGESRVAAMLEISEGARRVGDSNAAEKIFYGGLNGLASDSLENLKAKIDKLTITNLLEGIEIAPQSVIYVAGPNPGEEVTVFVIDKTDSTDPNNWKIYDVGTYKMDDTGKVAVEINFTDKMAGDFKNFELLVQNKSGEGSVREVMVNKVVEAKMDSVMLRNGEEVVPADLTDNGDFAKNLKTSILLAAETSKQEKNQDERIVLTGYAEPGSIIFISWESVLLSSAVIADASQGYFEVDVPKKLAKGEHKVLTYSYNKPKKTASSYSKVLFKKIF